MSKQILWLDNDKIFLAPHILRLETEGYIVKQAFTITEGLNEINTSKYDLLILDVMLPVNKQEEEFFPPGETNSGKQSGLVFYKKYKAMLKNKGITVFVFTIREDVSIREYFVNEELSPQNFMTKSEGADTAVFLARLKELLKEE
jgi:CheY-like chemotaxis protein